MEETKRCTKCGHDKPLSEFSLRTDYSKKNKHRSACKQCVTASALDNYHNKGGKQKQKDRAFKHLTKKYGLTTEEYEQERIKQNYSCLLCGTHESKSTHGRLHIDHCHTTGLFRGLLCMKCNVGLGSFGDDVEVMAKAIEYINENRSRHRDRLQAEQNLAGSH